MLSLALDDIIRELEQRPARRAIGEHLQGLAGLG